MSIKVAAKALGASQQLQEEDDEFLSTRARRFLLGSTLVRDACISRLQINYKRDLVSVKLYERFYSKWSMAVYYILMFLNLSTILLEYPAAIRVDDMELPYLFPLIINLVCEAYFYYRWYLINSMSAKGKLWDNILTKMSLGILLLMSLDAIIFIVCNTVPRGFPVRWSRFLRPVLLLTFPENRRLRAAFDSLRRTTLDVIPLFILMISVILLVSIVGVTTLAGQRLTYPNGTPYFPNFMNTFWDIYVLSTSANSPDVIVPAYEHNRIYISLYIVVCVLCNWLFMSILIACVYNSYRRHLGDFVVRVVAKQKMRLDEAFKLVATPMPTGEMGVSQGTFMRLMRIAKPGRTDDALRIIFHVLNRSRSGYLNSIEFARLAEYIRVKLDEIELSRKRFESFVPKFYHFYMAPGFQVFIRIVEHPVTTGFFIALVLANALTAVLLRGYPTVQISVEWFFTIFFILEVVAKYLACGGVGYFSDGWNRFDCAVIGLALFSQILQGGLETMGIALTGGITQMLLLLRLFRLLKFISLVPSFRTIVNSVISICPSLAAYACIMMIFYYIFTCLALEVFSYLYEPLRADNYTESSTCYRPHLLGTDYVKLHYCLFNFNSATESFVMLFAISVGNNWHMLADGTVRSTLNWARIFFLLVHWVCLLLVLNVVLAFIIEAYLMEYDAHTNKFEVYVRERLKELEVDAMTELEKRGLGHYGKPGFRLTLKELDVAFPPNAPVVKAFMLRDDVVSVEILLFRMFQREVEELAEKHKAMISSTVNKSHDPHFE